MHFFHRLFGKRTKKAQALSPPRAAALSIPKTFTFELYIKSGPAQFDRKAAFYI
jgi:hypothetical protein